MDAVTALGYLIGIALVSALVFGFCIVIMRWAFRVDDIVDRLDKIAKLIGPPK